MGYDLTANNPDAGDFHFGAFGFPVLLEACGHLWPCIHKGSQWYCVFEADPRLGDTYPRLLSNDGFAVTGEEAHIMARMARNFAAVQRSLPESHRPTAPTGGRDPWPAKIRDDWVAKFEEFAAWAERSGGFEIH